MPSAICAFRSAPIRALTDRRRGEGASRLVHLFHRKLDVQHGPVSGEGPGRIAVMRREDGPKATPTVIPPAFRETDGAAIHATMRAAPLASLVTASAAGLAAGDAAERRVAGLIPSVD
ncbi:FMN-binding negative transcriptional regulator [Methylobacterium terricola]|uniref:FMN-binding negative transcriptional regulator n=1 Tax=Methylobacterium terricola TaxID=2583531 RepID=A0A5C4L8S8_9HYPH|nr:hypothetical protein [Methylobacterium terricola]TNC07496.1 FMN-binding negative transcriptional regulator [Methylobacterium terricola]